jgi:2-keto-3-deoxy-galactonokinase
MRGNDELLSREQAEQYQKRLAMLSEAHVEDAYRKAFSDCALTDGKIQAPSAIQRLLYIWKVLWKWSKNR